MHTWLVNIVVRHSWNVRQRDKEARHVNVDVAESEAAKWVSHHTRNVEQCLIRDDLWTKAMASLSPIHKAFLQDWLGDKFKGRMEGSSEKSMLYRAMAQLRSFAAENLL